MPNHIAAVIRHVPFEDLGLIGPVLDRAAIWCRYHDLFDGAPAPEISSMSALILMGSPMSANDLPPRAVWLAQRAAGRLGPAGLQLRRPARNHRTH